MALVDDLGQVCEVREPWPDDLVDGVGAQVVARPASTQEAAALMRACHERGLAVTVRGAGTKQTWGMPPVRLDVILETTRIDRLVEHAHGDLIATAGAGLRLADLNAALAEHSQQLMVDDLVGGSTLGGLLATNLSGPRRLPAGAPRDLLIGVVMVRADGTVAKAGGKVVKNVAGYDLGKLLVGSFGTLGVITEATFRLHPLPVGSAWARAEVPLDRLEETVASVLHSQLVPTALEVDHPGGTAPARVAVLFTGTEQSAQARARTVGDLVPGAEVHESTDWPYHFPWLDEEAPGPVALKLTVQLSSVAGLVSRAAGLGVAVRGSAGAGVLYGALGAKRAAACVPSLRQWCREHGGALVVLDAPAEVKQELDAWGPINGLTLMRRVKEEFDPAGVLAPGRYVGGI